jgi:hypothetical protein
MCPINAAMANGLPTMGKVLAMCESLERLDQKGCDQAVRAIAITTYDAAGAPGTDTKLCLPPVTVEGDKMWHEKLVRWIRDHPEKQSLTEDTALYPFVSDTFRCH